MAWTVQEQAAPPPHRHWTLTTTKTFPPSSATRRRRMTRVRNSADHFKASSAKQNTQQYVLAPPAGEVQAFHEDLTGRQHINEVYKLSVDKLYDVLFTESQFMSDFMEQRGISGGLLRLLCTPPRPPTGSQPHWAASALCSQMWCITPGRRRRPATRPARSCTPSRCPTRWRPRPPLSARRRYTHSSPHVDTHWTSHTPCGQQSRGRCWQEGGNLWNVKLCNSMFFNDQLSELAAVSVEVNISQDKSKHLPLLRLCHDLSSFKSPLPGLNCNHFFISNFFLPRRLCTRSARRASATWWTPRSSRTTFPTTTTSTPSTTTSSPGWPRTSVAYGEQLLEKPCGLGGFLAGSHQFYRQLAK